MDAGTLFVSFWHLCLDNLPTGQFMRQAISAHEARERLDQARRQHRLRGVSDDDLLAPYRRRELRRQEQLCLVLRESYGINLTVGDFLVTAEEDPSTTSIFPLQCAQVRGRDCLLVVTALFAVPALGDGELLLGEIDAASVTFSWVEAV